MSGTLVVGTLDGMSMYEITSTTTTFLADEYEAKEDGQRCYAAPVPIRLVCTLHLALQFVTHNPH